MERRDFLTATAVVGASLSLAPLMAQGLALCPPTSVQVVHPPWPRVFRMAR